jgi:hypothetical protein
MSQSVPQKKRKLSRQEAKAVVPAAREFNRLADLFIKLFSQNIEQKEKRLNSVSYMVNGFKPLPKWHNTINIQSVDLKSSISTGYLGRSASQTDRWEDDFRQKRKGVVL